MAEVYLHLGGNVGDVRNTLASAKVELRRANCSILQESSFYETEAWGKTDQDNFLNQAILIATERNPESLLNLIHDIENMHGRERNERWGPRTLDIDILLYDKTILRKQNLTIPHPRLHERNFVLIPLMEIAGEMEHPIFQKTIEELYLESDDLKEVYLIEEE